MATRRRTGSGSSTRKRSSSSVKKETRSAARGRAETEDLARIHREVAAIALIAVGAFLVFALFVNAAGKLGDAIDTGVTGVFGVMANVLPFLLIAYGVLLIIGRIRIPRLRTIILASVIFIMLCAAIAGGHVQATSTGAIITGAPDIAKVFELSAKGDGAGVVGSYIAKGLVTLIGKPGLYILTIAVIVICVILLTNMSMAMAAGKVREKQASAREERQRRLEEQRALYRDDLYNDPNLETPGWLRKKKREATEDSEPSATETEKKINIINAVMNDEIYGDIGDINAEKPQDADAQDSYTEQTPEPEPAYPAPTAPPEAAPPLYEPSKSPKGASVRAPGPVVTSSSSLGKKPEGTMDFGVSGDDSDYVLPPVDLLAKPRAGAKPENPTLRRRNIERLEQALHDFKVDGKVINDTVGPTVTRYEVEPSVGVKIQSIRSLEPDLALKLEVKSVRVVPMPGKSVIGIEAYNANTSIVSLREIIDSEEFESAESKISFALGKNISGKRIIANLKEMPHLLIAGTTGSGKSVCINSILLSILYKAKPSEVKLILIDPKVVELKSYNDLPHLLVPVVTDPEKAAQALSFAVAKMNERYRLFSEHNVNNLESFNAKMRKEGKLDEVLPQIVIVIDELSDLMMVASAKVQESISRLAAMARAAGMHLIVATQQPLASILTSVIKANIPSRIAFAVSSNSASRVILDTPGAERLHGKGDMLYNPVGVRDPMRVQGAFVEEREVVRVVEFIKKQMDPDYSAELMAGVNTVQSDSLVDNGDELFLDAVEMVAQSKQASVSMIQRRFRVGYNRAARLVDMMEEHGIVAPSEGANKPRKLIMSETQIANFLSSGGRTDFVKGALGGEESTQPAPAPVPTPVQECTAEPEEEQLTIDYTQVQEAENNERPVRTFEDLGDFDD